jgi:hypothetical protein
LVPVESHSSGTPPGPHEAVPGMHDPVHAVLAPAPLQANGHALGVSRQMPCTSHCWITGAAGLHRRSPAAQPAPASTPPSSNALPPCPESTTVASTPPSPKTLFRPGWTPASSFSGRT